jgi:hypothetical protein
LTEVAILLIGVAIHVLHWRHRFAGDDNRLTRRFFPPGILSAKIGDFGAVIRLHLRTFSARANGVDGNK